MWRAAITLSFVKASQFIDDSAGDYVKSAP
jgi:hypothetical protein